MIAFWRSLLQGIEFTFTYHQIECVVHYCDQACKGLHRLPRSM